jgi:hypothetical protein
LFVALEHGAGDDGGVLAGADDDADGGFVLGATALIVIHPHIHVHLADVLIGEFTGLEIEDDAALEEVIVEDEIDVEVLGIGADALLASDEGEALAQFQQEGLQVIDEGLFEAAF